MSAPRSLPAAHPHCHSGPGRPSHAGPHPCRAGLCLGARRLRPAGTRRGRHRHGPAASHSGAAWDGTYLLIPWGEVRSFVWGRGAITIVCVVLCCDVQRVAEIAAGDYHSLAKTEQGRVSEQSKRDAMNDTKAPHVQRALILFCFISSHLAVCYGVCRVVSGVHVGEGL